MNNSKTVCPVCTLFLREGVTLQSHLDTHPKDQVIQALLKVSNEKNSSQGTSAPTTSEPSTASTATAAAAAFTPIQSFTNSNTAYISQGTPFINPQTQMTTAVTYQHYMTSNGTPLMPQYVQVPTIINPTNNVPSTSNQVNYVSSQALNYSPTMYNPLYNPYIPIPYPFTQPVFASYPVSAYPANEPNTQVSQTATIPVTSSQGVVPQTSVIVRKCSVATNTEADKRNSKDFGTKKSYSKITATTRKVKFFKQKTSDTSSARVIIKSVGGTGVKKSVIRTLRSKIATEPSSSNSTIVISPPPLTPIAGTPKRSISGTKTPTPPPLTKAPCFNSDFVRVIKSETATDSSESENIETENITLSNEEFLEAEQKPNTVIVNSNTLIPSNNEVRDCNEIEEIEIHTVDPLLENIEKTKETEMELAKQKSEEEEKSIEEKDFADEEQNEQERIFEIFEVEEERKIAVTEANLNQTSEREKSEECERNNFSDVGVFVQKEIQVHKEVQETRISEGIFPDYVPPEVKNSEENQSESDFTLYSGQIHESHVEEPDIISKHPDLQSVTYTDLQPAKNSKVFQDLGLPTSLTFNNFMEVDGFKIFFNNNTSTVSLDSVLKLTAGLQTGTKNSSALIKNDNQSNNHNIVDSVIQMVSGSSESKKEITFGDNFTPTTSQDLHQLELQNLSPLALNIQADESMPARGELSEQESLGAENSSWNLFHGSCTNETKPLEEWRNINTQAVSIIEVKKPTKAFKCSVCNEVFSCPKERRVHKNTVHLEKANKPPKPSPTKKAKSYACSFCSEHFTSIRDRKVHISEMHKNEDKNKRSTEIKQETSEAEGIDVVDSSLKKETPSEEVKTETSLPFAEGEPHRVKYCPKCSLPCLGVKKLREHLRIVHNEIRFKCDTCSAHFDEESEYNEHLLIHPLKCDKCGKTFHKKANLNLHLKRHLKVKPYECSLCPKSFITRQKLEEHMNGHSGKKPLKCNLCDKTFSRHSNLIQHRNLHHLNVKKKIKDFVCRCGEVFHSLRKLEWHKEIHEPKPKPCPFCSQKFIHSASVTRHIRRAHLPDYLPGDNREFDNVQCPVCEKTYLRSSLMVHMRVHNGEKPFACKICNKRFSTKWNLELHSWTHQSRSNMPFKCQICKSAFFRETDFVAHSNAHRNHKPYTCNVCGQKFIRKYSCLRHQEEHKKSKQFVCAVSGCSKSFHRGYYLRDHMKVHTGVRPHTCHICGKASSTKSNHNKHVRIHDTREPVNTEN